MKVGWEAASLDGAGDDGWVGAERCSEFADGAGLIDSSSPQIDGRELLAKPFPPAFWEVQRAKRRGLGCGVGQIFHIHALTLPRSHVNASKLFLQSICVYS